MIINYENVQVELPFEILHIKKLNFTAEVNEHHTLKLEALISEENAEKYLEESVDWKEVKLLVNKTPIYVGKIIKLEICYKGQVAYLKLKTISYSYDLDIKKHKLAFINLNSTYEDVIKKVLSKYANVDFKDDISNGKTIKNLLVQYEETDFEFLKRLASHFETVLVVNSTSSSHRIHFGVETSYKEAELEPHFSEVKTSFEEFNKIRNSINEEIGQQNFIGWKAIGNEYIPLCSEIIYEGQRVCVTKVDMEISNGEINYTYVLKFLKGIKTTYIINSKLKGISLEGIVKNRRNNEVQVHFCINDSYENVESNKWFFFGREVSNFYCMPLIEDKVRISFLAGDEKDTIITNSVRIAGADAKYYSKISTPSNKSYSTENGQELLMTPDKLQIAEDDGKSIQITLNKNGSINLTGKNISLDASKNIEIGTSLSSSSNSKVFKPKSIKISAKNKVTVTRSCKGVNSAESIQLAEENHLRGIVKLL
ncbi:hypothetical protein [Clostridium saccharoperbutylacetonicum]|uniref:hypothetical protein n=1 Tax=Clostridium saccharoperbutylacetonicum TaxID=36745 RepID=UPI0009839605|nr:hypothetical protein [Clostridium saccharoperbutylacetonicum]AQR96126.1 hypothetical protein CLSAP_34450 [Clostridium saccharoperbutylacetonicum]NSB31995.1 hypothetical protein [Clostridium saccharoperbutylacetonicum]